MKMSARFADAFAFANELHRDQTRKGNTIPYISHLMSVSALVLEHGGDEDQAIAGLLHDAVEDQGGLATARLIEEKFGRRVRDIVLACTDAAPEPGERKIQWAERKQAYVEHLPTLPEDAAVVVVCDKLHNLACLIADLEREGPGTLDRFEQPSGLVWYYASVAEALEGIAPAEPLRSLPDRAGRPAAKLPMPLPARRLCFAQGHRVRSIRAR